MLTSFDYSGDVTLTVKNKNGLTKSFHTHNAGEQSLFKLIALFLSGNEIVSEQLPQKIVLERCVSGTGDSSWERSCTTDMNILKSYTYSNSTHLTVIEAILTYSNIAAYIPLTGYTYRFNLTNSNGQSLATVTVQQEYLNRLQSAMGQEMRIKWELTIKNTKE